MRAITVLACAVAPSVSGAVLGVLLGLTWWQVVAAIVVAAGLAGYALAALQE